MVVRSFGESARRQQPSWYARVHPRIAPPGCGIKAVRGPTHHPIRARAGSRADSRPTPSGAPRARRPAMPRPFGNLRGVVQLVAWLAIFQTAASALSWQKLGDAIDDASYGYVVSASGDGSRVALCSLGDLVRVYEWRSTRWQQIGDDITRSNQDEQVAQAISLSPDGNHLAVSFRRYDPMMYSSATFRVRVYEWTGDRWTPRDAVDGADGFGDALSLSADGSRLAVGNPTHPQHTCTEGVVTVYEWDEGDDAWGQMGDAVLCYNKTDDRAGHAVALSGDGQRLAVGAPYNDAPDVTIDDWHYGGNYTYSPSENRGLLRIYQWSPSCACWETMSFSAYNYEFPTDSEGNVHSSKAGSRLGEAISMSHNGSRVIVGQPGNAKTWNGQGSGVAVFEWIPVADAWVKLRHFSTYFTGSGRSVSISPDGGYVCFGSEEGSAFPYRWSHGEWRDDGPSMGYYNDGHWIPMGEYDSMGESIRDPDVTGWNSNSQFGWTVAISHAVVGHGHTTRVAVGNPPKGNVVVMHITYCDASAAPENGDVGDCPKTLEPGGTCRPTCDDGYLVTGLSSCGLDGVFTPALCLTGERINSTSVGNGWQSDGFGTSVAMSGDGNRMAVMETAGAGTVRVYELNSGSWARIGNDIHGAADGDQQAESTPSSNSVWSQTLSFSRDGSRLAVGAPRHDGQWTDTGQVRVYELDSNEWVVVGGDIDPTYSSNQRFGGSVSLSGDGTRLAVGSKNRVFSVYQLLDNQTYWTQMGSTVYVTWLGCTGRYCNIPEGTNGALVSLSSDGLSVAVGVNGNQVATVYRFNESQAWDKVGADVGQCVMEYTYGPCSGAGYCGYCMYPFSMGTSIAMSGDARRVIVGTMYTYNSPSSAIVYQLDDTDPNNLTWSQMGSKIERFQSNDFTGSSVSMSEDGTRVVVGSKYNTATGQYDGMARVYEWASDDWILVGAPIYGGWTYDRLGQSASISNDGSRVVLGTDSVPYQGGVPHVVVYDLPRLDAPSGGGSIDAGGGAVDNGGADLGANGGGANDTSGVSSPREPREDAPSNSTRSAGPPGPPVAQSPPPPPRILVADDDSHGCRASFAVAVVAWVMTPIVA